MLNLENVAVAKGDKTILKNVNLIFKAGKSYALIGPSGGGKSTLLNVIAGFEKLQQGNVIYKEKNLKKQNKVQFYRHELGYLFQNYGLVENMSVLDNIEIGIAFKKWTKKEKLKVIEDEMKALNLNIDVKRKTASLSGGEQQRIALIRLLLKNPDLILADEPTGSLDQKNGNMIVSQLLKLVEKNKTLIMATHDMNIAKQCDEIIDISKFREYITK